MEEIKMNGTVIALIGIALCMILCGTGSAIGLFKTGTAAAGVLSEDPKKFSKVMVLVVLPATQGIYGFVMAILASSSVVSGMEAAEGWAIFAKVMPIAIVGLISAIYQGRTAVNCILAVAKQETLGGKLILFPAMVETYAILALVISIMM